LEVKVIDGFSGGCSTQSFCNKSILAALENGIRGPHKREIVFAVRVDVDARRCHLKVTQH
jgi:hypothetical protein